VEKPKDPADPIPIDPVIEAYKQGVDRTLLVENLRLSVDARMENLQSVVRFLEEVRRAGREARTRP